jgi:hypothetical protein
MRTRIRSVLRRAPILLGFACCPACVGNMDWGSSSASHDESDASPARCLYSWGCDSSEPSGPRHGVRQDGTVDVTPQEAWPNRQPEPPPLTAAEVAQACALMVACQSRASSGPAVSASELLAECLNPVTYYFWEERAVPTREHNERWTFEARAVLASEGNCEVVLGGSTPRAEPIVCDEAGCWWRSSSLPIPNVTCSGDHALLRSVGNTFERDCARSLQKCDPASPTGCTDRAPVACDPAGRDRCDGDIRLGCDASGKVSFHDCTRLPGGKCVSTRGAPQCEYPTTTPVCPSDAGKCNGSRIKLCTMGEVIEVDCGVLGLAGCLDDHCVGI